jgi:hypothetical protein
MENQYDYGPEEFLDSHGSLWRRNQNGNYCRYELGSPPDGVIFRRPLGGWSGNSSRLGVTVFVYGGRDDPEHVADVIGQGEAEGLSSDVWADRPGIWTANKAGTGEWAWINGTKLTVKATKPRAGYSQSYSATVGLAMLKNPNDQPGAVSVDEAKAAAQQAARRSG